MSVSHSKTDVAFEILESGFFAAQPHRYIFDRIKNNSICLNRKTIDLSNYRKIHVVAFGKAANSMTLSANSLLNISSGIVTVPKKSKPSPLPKKFTILESGHPIPTNQSVIAGKKTLDFVKSIPADDFILFLISGGGSSLLCYPDKISLYDKRLTTKQLIACGSTISEINCIRKHLSKIKGGKLSSEMNCDGVALVMSDVIGNDLSVISSGCTFPDRSTTADALQILSKYHIKKKIPSSVIRHLQSSIEIPKKQKIIPHQIIATNKNCLDAMVKKSKSLGLSTIVLPPLESEISKCVQIISKSFQKTENFCLIFGGEPTVHVKGDGKGGRNQELVLRLLQHLKKDASVIASLATDGIDGNTAYAGALVTTDNFSFSRLSSFLKNNDSNSFFKKFGGLLKTGYTQTNLLDIGLLLY